MKDNEAQNLDRVVRDLMLRDFLTANGKYIQKEARRKLGTKENDRNTKYLQPPQIRITRERGRRSSVYQEGSAIGLADITP